MFFQPSTLAKASKGLGSQLEQDSKDAKLRLFTSLVHCRTCRCSGTEHSESRKRLLKTIRSKIEKKCLPTPPRIDLLCMKNWGTQWTIEIRSNA